MTLKELAQYLEQITQTKICEDLNYCNQLLKIFLNK